MSDLISREVLYREIARLEELARGRVLDTPSSSPCYARYRAQLNERTSLKHIIADMPTAYSVDKVLEQLRKQDDVCTGCKHKECSWCSIGERIEIVRRGGKDE